MRSGMGDAVVQCFYLSAECLLQFVWILWYVYCTASGRTCHALTDAYNARNNRRFLRFEESNLAFMRWNVVRCTYNRILRRMESRTQLWQYALQSTALFTSPTYRILMVMMVMAISNQPKADPLGLLHAHQLRLRLHRPGHIPDGTDGPGRRRSLSRRHCTEAVTAGFASVDFHRGVVVQR